MVDRCFYHSFPRRKPDESQLDLEERALRILGLMKAVGLILAPEVVTWDVSALSGQEEQLSFFQRRACFTELAAAELPLHAEKFGLISLEFQTDELRKIGAMPVIYIPQAIKDQLTSNLATFAVRGAVALKHVLEQLLQVEQIAVPEKALAIARAQFGTQQVIEVADDYNITLNNTDKDGKIVQTYDIKSKDVAALMKYMQFNNISFEHSIAILDMMQSIFYPTDNLYANQILGYYRQREWRIVSHNIGFPLAMCVELDPKQIANLIEIDSKFWSCEISDNKIVKRRVDLARLYRPSENWSLFDHVQRIIVPDNLVETVREMMGERISISAVSQLEDTR